MGSGNRDLWSFGCIFNFHNIELDTFCWLEVFTLHLFGLCQHRIYFSEVDTDIPSRITLYNACHDIPLFIEILMIEGFPLFLTNLLDNNLFCLLSCDTSEVSRCHLNMDNITQFTVNISQPRIGQTDLKNIILHLFYNFFFRINNHITGVSVNIYPDIVRFTILVFAGSNQ